MSKSSYWFDVTLVSIVIWLAIFSVFLLLVNFQIVDFDNKFSINWFVNSILALTIALLVPKSLWKALDNKKISKWILVSRCQKLQDDSEAIINYVSEINGKTKKDKHVEEILSNLIVILDNRFATFKKHLNKECPKVPIDELDETFRLFRSDVTDNLRSNQFTFDFNYKCLIRKAFSKLESEIESCKFSINET